MRISDNLRLPADRRGWAIFDETKTYRYSLGRLWDAKKPRCAFIMLNPSTADASQLDPTVQRCVQFAKEWGCGSLEVGNIFALRSTDPNALRRAADPIGPENDAALKAIANRARRVVVAWGNHGAYRGRDEAVRVLLFGRDLMCLGVTSKGQPIHPLYVPALRPLRPFQVHAGGRR